MSIDTLRADRLGCYGYARATTPALDRFAAEHAVRFASAVAESSWTLPSHVTMLSGLHPLTHGVRRPEDAPGDEVELLAARLAAAGYYSFAVTDGGWLSETWGFERGFASFHARDQDVERAVEQTLEYVRFRQPRGPWFALLHTYDVHCPYDPPPPYAGTFTSAAAEPIEVAGLCGNPDFNALAPTPGQARFLSDRYDEDVRRVDDALARLFAACDELELWRDTIVIVTSDHGEEFLEHGQIGHERSLEREVLAIPLLLAAPGFAPRSVEAPVGLADVVPTVLELVGNRAPLDGRSLVRLMRGEPDPGRAPAVLSDLAWQRELAATTSAEASRVFDLASPGVDLPAELAKERARLSASGYKPRPVDPAPRADELRGLGY